MVRIYELPLKEFPLAFFQSLMTQEFWAQRLGSLSLDYEHFERGGHRLID